MSYSQRLTLSDLEQFQELRRKLALTGCAYCGTLHPAKQCLNPRNASKSGFARHSSRDIMEANAIAAQEQGVYELPPRRIVV